MLAVGDIGQDLGGHPVGEGGHPFGVARRTKISSATRERQDHLMATVWIFTTNPGKSVAEVAAIQESVGYFADHRPPEAVLIGKAFLVNSLEFIKVIFDQAIKWGCLGIAR
jgi:hypothetical protein